MSSAASTSQERVLAEELGAARRLVSERDYGVSLNVVERRYVAVLDALERAHASALAAGDAAALEEVWLLARTVWERAPAGSPNAERAALLGRVAVADLAMVRPGRAHASFGDSDVARAAHRSRGSLRLARGRYLLVVALAVVAALLAAAAAFGLAWDGFGSAATATLLTGVWTPVAALVLRSVPGVLSVLLAAAAASMVALQCAAFSREYWTDASDCAGKLAAAVTKTPDRYWTAGIVVAAVAGAVLIAGVVLSRRSWVGNLVLAIGGLALVVGTGVFWSRVDDRLASYYPECGGASGGMSVAGTTMPVLLLALAAVIAGWNPHKPMSPPTASRRRNRRRGEP